MSEGYAKLLSTILDSSIWREPDDVVRVWITLLAMADKDGFVGASVDGIASRTRTVSEERVQECLELFRDPDPRSRNKAFDGRRLQEVHRGWLILNYKEIRGMHGHEAELERKRKWWTEHRSSNSSRKPTDNEMPVLASSTTNDRPALASSFVSGSANASGSGSGSPEGVQGEPAERGRLTPSVPPVRQLIRPNDRMALAMAACDPLVPELFRAWQEAAGKPGARLDAQRAALFQRLALDGVTVDEVRQVVAGARLDDWACNRQKLAPSAILGSAEQREKFIELGLHPPELRPGQPGYEKWGPGGGNGLQPNDPDHPYVPRVI